MIFENLTLDRVIIHEVFVRDDDRGKVPPRYGEQLIALDAEATDALRARVVEAMGRASHCMEMAIAASGKASFLALVEQLAAADESHFVEISRSVADKLADAQQSRKIPGGVLVVISGRAGPQARQVICVIKAETHSGFVRQSATKGLSLRYLKDLILTPQTKLYKIGAFVAAAEVEFGWRPYIYDHQMSATNRLSAAQYFYEGFLGCSFLETDAKRTREFHDYTKDFIRGLDLPEETKTGLYNALTTYLRVDQRPTVEVNDFAQSYFYDAATRDTYAQFMRSKEFPMTAIHKDLSEVASSLKYRKVQFSNDIRLTAPAEKFADMVRMRTIDGEPNGDGQVPIWTEIIVRDRIRGQE